MKKDDIPICTIIGKSVNELPFGMDEKYPKCTALKINLAAKINELYLNGVTHFACNCEYGIPLWAAEIILALKIYKPELYLHIVAPYEEQAAKWNEEIRERYFNIHEKADTVHILKNIYNDNILSYHYAEKFMLDNSTMLLIDEHNNEIIRYARKCNLNIVYLDNKSTSL